jgi:hypothetical protein
MVGRIPDPYARPVVSAAEAEVERLLADIKPDAH